MKALSLLSLSLVILAGNSKVFSSQQPRVDPSVRQLHEQIRQKNTEIVAKIQRIQIRSMNLSQECEDIINREVPPIDDLYQQTTLDYFFSGLSAFLDDRYNADEVISLQNGVLNDLNSVADQLDNLGDQLKACEENNREENDLPNDEAPNDNITPMTLTEMEEILHEHVQLNLRILERIHYGQITHESCLHLWMDKVTVLQHTLNQVNGDRMRMMEYVRDVEHFNNTIEQELYRCENSQEASLSNGTLEIYPYEAFKESFSPYIIGERIF